jgi:hypothetical protein
MEIKRIKAPKFRVGRYVLNEYEFRNLQLEVALGIKPAGIKVTDSLGNKSTIIENGCLSHSLNKTMGISGNLSLELLRANRRGE